VKRKHGIDRAYCRNTGQGGSKRIPKKNIKPFCGKPIISYSIEAALASGLFDKVIVSTDSEDIASVAAGCGAEVPFVRPARLSDDYTGTNEVTKHAIQWYNTRGTEISYACCIYATAPFLQPVYLKEGYEKLVKFDKSFAFSVTSFAFPIQRAVRITEDGWVDAIHPENNMTRSQDLEEAYHDAGQFYWGSAQSFLNDVTTFSPASVPIILPRYHVQDIDTEEDWERAELMFLTWQKMQGRSG